MVEGQQPQPTDETPSSVIDLRGKTGHLYGKLDTTTWTLAFKHKGQIETIDLRPLLQPE